MATGKCIELESNADGTRYRVLVMPDRHGGWIVTWPDGGWTGATYNHNRARQDVRFDRSWGAKVSKKDVANLAIAAWYAIDLLKADLEEATLKGWR